MINIGFWSSQLGERGTEIALFDYAYYNETILGNKSFVFYDKNNYANDIIVIEKFNKNLTTIPLNNFNEIDNFILQHDIKILYNIKFGINDGNLSKNAKNIVHCVFECNQPHGDVYCSISKWVNNYNNNIPIIPHIVSLPIHDNNLRNELNIPDDACVFGRHGGYNQFDIRFVHSAVYNVALKNPKIYFLFVNTKQFCPSLNNIIHLGKIINLNDKRKFINTCDAMLWARSDGETFGLSIAEFSICNKPVIATKIGDIAHIKMLGNKGYWYNNEENLVNILTNFNRDYVKYFDWNAYNLYTPENVMKIFDEIAIAPFI